MVSSASNDYLDGACDMSSRLIVELPDVAEDNVCFEEENEDQFVEVRNRKLSEKNYGRFARCPVRPESFRPNRESFRPEYKVVSPGV